MAKQSPRLAAAKVVARRKAMQVLKNRFETEKQKLEAMLDRPLDVSLQIPKEVVQVDVGAPSVNVDAPNVQVTVPENAIKVMVQADPPTVNTPVQVTIPENAIKVDVHIKADAPAIIPPLTPPDITFSPKLPDPPPPRKTSYKIIRHEFTDQIERIDAVDL